MTKGTNTIGVNTMISGSQVDDTTPVIFQRSIWQLTIVMGMTGFIAVWQCGVGGNRLLPRPYQMVGGDIKC